MTPRNDQNTQRPAPPPVRQHTGRTIMVLACAGIIALLLIVVVLNIDTTESDVAANQRDDDVIELIDPPSALTEHEEQQLTGPDADPGRTMPLEVPRGGWLQMQDDDGRLAQRFRFTRSEPRPAGKPEGWSRLENPEAELFVSDDQAVVMRGDEALAYIPSQGLEEGSISGDVVIEVYPVDDTRVIDRQRQTPTFIVRTAKATFDNMIGEVRCPGAVELISPGKAEIYGNDLVLRINDMIDRLELLDIAQVDYIRLMTPEDAAAGATEAAHAPLRSPAQPRVRLASFQDTDAERDPPDADGDDSPDEAQFYELTLASNVTITQGPVETVRVARGEALSIVFSPKSRGFDDATAADSQPPAPMANMQSVTAALASMFIANVDAPATPSANVPQPGVDETIITFDGPLRVLPIDDDARRLASPEDSRFVLSGSPVELTDDAEQARATAGRLVYSSLERRVELIRVDGHAVNIESPKLTAGGDRFWLAQQTGEGGFAGEGWLRPVPDSEPDATNEADARDELLASMSVTWSKGVELAFGRAPQDDALGPLEQVRFDGNVRVNTNDGAINAETLDLSLRPGADGEPVADVLIATGNVKAHNADQIIWADALEVQFMHDAEAQPAVAPEPEESLAADADIRRITAHGNIQILMADGSRVFADRLEGDGVNETLDLFGTNIVIAAGQMLIERGTEVRVRQGDRSAHWIGRGMARVFEERLNTTVDERLLRPSLAALSSGEMTETMTVTWTDGVDLGFAPPDERDDAGSNPGTDPDTAGFGRLERVAFNGDVQVDSDDGAIASDTLDLVMAADDAGQPQPELMTAAGHVVARNDEQTIWADELNVQFIAAADGDAAPGSGHDESSMDALRGDVRVKRVTAHGDIQILMADGSRAFADRLEGDGINETLDLFGDNIVIASGRMLCEQGIKLTLRKDEQTALWDGSGRVRIVKHELDTAADQRIDRPNVDEAVNPVSVRVTWNESMVYDHGFNNGAGSVDLRGDVNAFSAQNPLEENRMTGEALTLEFVSTDSSGSGRPSASESGDEFGDRQLKRFVARGDAKLESRTWQSESRQQKPRVFYIAGEHIEYDDQTFEARVLGDGTLLLRDEWADEPEGVNVEDAPAGPRLSSRGAAPGTSFSGKGTSLFTWSRHLHMQQVLDDRYSIDMAGEVTVIHEGADGGTATLTAEQLSAVVTRLDEQRRRGAGLDVGGAMDLRRLTGSGAALIETPTRTVECASFEYNVDTAMAQLKGDRARPVTIINEGAAYPLYAQEVLWNMTQDTITIVRGAGAGGQ